MVAVVALFFIKTTSIFKNKETYKRVNQENGLTYGNLTIKDLVNKDTDDDGILDWQESLYGLDPTKKETTPGIPDSTAIVKLKTEQKISAKTNENKPNTENLTKTDQFSRELVSAMVALNQNGVVDQTTIDKLGAILAEKIQNPEIRKVFSISDIKTTSDNSLPAFQNYLQTFETIHKKYPDMDYTVLEVLQKFMVDENNVDISVLAKLDPIIEQNNKIITALTKMEVPESISALHLDIINSLERLGENASDIRLFDTDPILSLGGITQYEKNVARLETSLNNFSNAIKQKFNS